MTTQFPDYPCDSNGNIPEQMCFDVIRIWAEYGGAYLWDMNGVCSSATDVTGAEIEDLDKEFEEWQSLYEQKPINEHEESRWDSNDERAQFDRDGLALCKKLYDRLGCKKTVVYYSTDMTVSRFDATGKPPVRLDDQS